MAAKEKRKQSKKRKNQKKSFLTKKKVLLIIVLAAVIWLFGPYLLQPFRDNTAAFTSDKAVEGIDVSSYQEKIDWQKVSASGIKFAFIRLGYRGYQSGKIVKDSYYDYNFTEAKKYGLKRGIYFASQAVNEKEAIEEADYCVKMLKKEKLDLPIAYDFEYPETSKSRTSILTFLQMNRNTDAFCQEIKKAGYHPIVYMSQRYYRYYFNMRFLNHYPVWLAYYRNKPISTINLAVWQYSEKGHVDGIQGNVDLDRMPFLY